MIRFSIMMLLLALAGGMNAIVAQAADTVSVIASNESLQAARMHLFQQSITWFGQVESRHSVPLVSRVAGRIASLNVEDEASVDVGDILFELAGTALESQITDLKQQRHQANKELQLAQKNLRLIRHKQQQRLAIHEQVNAARNILAQVKARISKIKQRLISLASGIRITAPMHGVFTARSVQIGQYITAGTQLARIIDTHHLRIRASLFPPAHITILVGQIAVIHGSLGDTTGVVSAIMPETTAEGGRQIWILGDAVQQPQLDTKKTDAQNPDVQNPDAQNLIPGMQLSGNIILPYKAVAVPQTAIARDDAGHAFVFIRKAKQWRKQQIITGMRDQGWVEVRSGLQAGDQLASEGAYEMLYRDFSSTYHEPD